MAAPHDHLTTIGSDKEDDADPPPAAEASDAPSLEEEEASQAPPPIPLFTEAQACELVEHPTTDSLKVSWAEVVQTAIAGSVPEGVSLPACSLNYELALREVRPHHPFDIAGHQQYNIHPGILAAGPGAIYLQHAVLGLQAHCCTVYPAIECTWCAIDACSNQVTTAAVRPVMLRAQVTTDPHNGHAPAANGEWISVYRGHQSAAQASMLCLVVCAFSTRALCFASRTDAAGCQQLCCSSRVNAVQGDVCICKLPQLMRPDQQPPAGPHLRLPRHAAAVFGRVPGHPAAAAVAAGQLLHGAHRPRTAARAAARGARPQLPQGNGEFLMKHQWRTPLVRLSTVIALATITCTSIKPRIEHWERHQVLLTISAAVLPLLCTMTAVQVGGAGGNRRPAGGPVPPGHVSTSWHRRGGRPDPGAEPLLTAR